MDNLSFSGLAATQSGLGYAFGAAAVPFSTLGEFDLGEFDLGEFDLGKG